MANTNWTGAGDGSTWEDADNWDNGLPGGSNFTAEINDSWNITAQLIDPGITISVGVWVVLNIDIANEAIIQNEGLVNISGVNYGNISGSGQIQFINAAINYTSVSTSFIRFLDFAQNIGQLTSGDIIFYNSSENEGIITGDVRFYNFSSNNTSGIINGNAFFYDEGKTLSIENISGYIVLPSWIKTNGNIESINPQIRIKILDVPEGSGDILGTGLL